MNGGYTRLHFVALVSSLGYEYHHQQNLKTMRGAKSNALLFRGANCHPGCPCVALVIFYSLCGRRPSSQRVFGITKWVTLERTYSLLVLRAFHCGGRGE